MNAQPIDALSFADRLHERRIAAQARVLDAAMRNGNSREAMRELDALKELLAERSAEAVAWLEKARGIARA